MTSLYKPTTLILKFYYMSNGPTFEIFKIFFTAVRTCIKFQGNPLRLDGEIDKNHALQINQNNCVPDIIYCQILWLKEFDKEI